MFILQGFYSPLVFITLDILDVSNRTITYSNVLKPQRGHLGHSLKHEIPAPVSMKPVCPYSCYKTHHPMMSRLVERLMNLYNRTGHVHMPTINRSDAFWVQHFQLRKRDPASILMDISSPEQHRNDVCLWFQSKQFIPAIFGLSSIHLLYEAYNAINLSYDYEYNI